MKAKELLHQRIILGEDRFADIVLWQLRSPLAGSDHHYKYRLAYVVRECCVLRYDNESGKGDHRHYAGKEFAYTFVDIEELIENFKADIRRWDRENRHT